MSALIFGHKQFKTYLLGEHFLIRVDHMAITYYRQTKEPVGQQERLLDCTAQFHFDVKYRDGSRHINADCLSRLTHVRSTMANYVVGVIEELLVEMNMNIWFMGCKRVLSVKIIISIQKNN